MPLRTQRTSRLLGYSTLLSLAQTQHIDEKGPRSLGPAKRLERERERKRAPEAQDAAIMQARQVRLLSASISSEEATPQLLDGPPRTGNSTQADGGYAESLNRIPGLNMFIVCVDGLLQTDPQERAKTTTASSDCRPRPTVPDPVVPCLFFIPQKPSYDESS